MRMGFSLSEKGVTNMEIEQAMCWIKIDFKTIVVFNACEQMILEKKIYMYIM
jgi:hypothetical protein